MKFILEIRCGGAAFEPTEDGGASDTTLSEIACILRRAARDIENGGDRAGARLFDVNGNRCGFYMLDESADDRDA